MWISHYVNEFEQSKNHLSCCIDLFSKFDEAQKCLKKKMLQVFKLEQSYWALNQKCGYLDLHWNAAI